MGILGGANSPALNVTLECPGCSVTVAGTVGSSKGSVIIAAQNITVEGLVQGGLACTESANWPTTCPGSHSNVTSDAKLLFMAHYLAVAAKGVLQAGSILICPFSSAVRQMISPEALKPVPALLLQNMVTVVSTATLVLSHRTNQPQN